MKLNRAVTTRIVNKHISLIEEIKVVASELNRILESDDAQVETKMIVTKDDELSELIQAFNNIQNRERRNLQRIKENQEVMIEQERLANLGQLIGGIAHNLKSPIMSLSGAIGGLKDLVEEYEGSIDDPEVTSENHHEIAKEMLEWLQKMKPYCGYMSDVITAVKAQTVSPGSSDEEFTLKELTERIDLLMAHQLRIHRCRLSKSFALDLQIKIKGEITFLVQIIGNLIMNAAHAYNGVDGIIEFGIILEENKILITIKDFGEGIKAEIQEKLFHEMVTSKGKDGTGLGLYISHSSLKARFAGDLWFESTEGLGTCMFLRIPCII